MPLARRLPTICKNLRNERVTQIVDKHRCIKEQIFFSNYFMLVVFISSVKFPEICFLRCEISCEVWSFKYKNNSSVVAIKITWNQTFLPKLNRRKRENSLSVFYRNSPKYGNDQRGKLDRNWLKFYGERNIGLSAITRITAPSYKQPSKLSQLQNTQLNFLTVTFLAILKWTEINLRWLIVYGRVKEAKDWRLPLTFRSEI